MVQLMVIRSQHIPFGSLRENSCWVPLKLHLEGGMKNPGPCPDPTLAVPNHNRLHSLLLKIRFQFQFAEKQGVSEEEPQIRDNQSPISPTARRTLGTCSTSQARSEPVSTAARGQYLGLVQACPKWKTVALTNLWLTLANQNVQFTKSQLNTRKRGPALTAKSLIKGPSYTICHAHAEAQVSPIQAPFIPESSGPLSLWVPPSCFPWLEQSLLPYFCKTLRTQHSLAGFW